MMLTLIYIPIIKRYVIGTYYHRYTCIETIFIALFIESMAILGHRYPAYLR